ncbi:TetR/AcrR family transcriptional regulator [Spiractinospora alimapuensis]|uniref:TetR/AcrR family transcriptional regulator n=1 Tax=Spiractinospora alimapuensis TaxID=2820884 RepID=UPI001F1A3A94|nr:TetR/AcrR family transcriptional regulator [Spiractinospora alimapuensis]
MSSPTRPDAEVTGARARTRRAILDAAASVWARDRTATLADVARAAGVGRTTLHRYFPDRARLVEALVLDAYTAIDQASVDAAMEQGTAREALRRLIHGMIGEGEKISFLFGEATSTDSTYDFSQDDEEEDDFDRRFEQLVARGKASGEFASDLADGWIISAVWSLIYAGVGAANEGTLPRHGVAEAVIRCVEGGITPAS